MSEEAPQLSAPPDDERELVDGETQKPPKKRQAVGVINNQKSSKSGKVGHESWVRAFLPPEVTQDSTTFQCLYCQANLSLKNISRVKTHLLNPKVCGFIRRPEAIESAIEEIVAARQQMLGGTGSAADIPLEEGAAVAGPDLPQHSFMHTLLEAANSREEDIGVRTVDRQVAAGPARQKPKKTPSWPLRPRPLAPKSTTNIKVGVIGAGRNTVEHHIPKLLAIEGVTVTIVANRSADSAKEVCQTLGIIKWTGNWREVMDDESIDAIVIGTWPYMHHTLVIEALRAGKHVLTEARMAMDAKEAKQMYQESMRHPHLVAQIVPAPLTLELDKTIQTLIANQNLGELLDIEVKALSGNFPDGEGSPMTWRQDVQYSGANTMMLGIFYEPLLRWMGPAVQVQAMADTRVKLRIDTATSEPAVAQVPDHLVVTAKMAIGAIARITVSSVVGTIQGLESPNQLYVIHGSKGTLYVDVGNERLTLLESGAVGPVDVPIVDPIGWRVEQEFIGAIRGKEKIRRTDFYTGMQYMEFTEAVRIAYQTGTTVHLPLPS